MNILVNVNGGNTNNKEVEAALITLSADNISLLLERKETFTQLSAKDKVLSELSYHSDIHTRFYGYEEGLEDLLDYGDNIFNPPSTWVGDEVRCEGIYLKICERGFYLSLRKKHCDYEYFTDIITWQELEENYEEE